METEKWKDGSDKVCSICHEPIYKGQSYQGTISQKPGKRDCYHFLCAGGTVTVIGTGEVTVFRK